MSSFTDKLTVTKYVGEKETHKFLFVKWTTRSDYWITERDFRYYVGCENSSDFIDVLKGTKTDFASIPRIFRGFIDCDGIHSQAAVLHDFLYTTHIRSRKDSDKIFLEAMSVLGVQKWKRLLMYYSVKIFGNSSWKQCGNTRK